MNTVEEWKEKFSVLDEVEKKHLKMINVKVVEKYWAKCFNNRDEKDEENYKIACAVLEALGVNYN